MICVRHFVVSVACVATYCAGAGSSTAHAQTPGDGGGRFEIVGGVTWTGHVSLGTVAATETAPTGRFTLFSTSTQLTSAPGVDARFGVRLTPALEVEAATSYARPRLQTAVSGDVEGAPSLSASESVGQYVIDGAVLWHLLRWRMGDRTTPFVLAGAGYVRELHESETLAVAGQRVFRGRWIHISADVEAARAEAHRRPRGCARARAAERGGL